MEKKENTPMRETRRRYEEKNKEERKALNKVWGTSIPRKNAEEIDEFLRKNNMTKVDLIFAGFMALQEQIKEQQK